MAMTIMSANMRAVLAPEAIGSRSGYGGKFESCAQPIAMDDELCDHGILYKLILGGSLHVTFIHLNNFKSCEHACTSASQGLRLYDHGVQT